MSNLSLHMRGPEVGQLQKQLQELGYNISEQELGNQTFGVATRYALLQVQNRYGLSRSGELDEGTQQILQTATQLAQAPVNVQGQLFFDNGQAASGVTINIYNFDQQGQKTLVGSAQTDAKGFYNQALRVEKQQELNLAITAISQNEDKEIALNKTRYNAAPQEIMNLVVPQSSVKKLGSEFQRLGTDLRNAGWGNSFADIKENKDRQDISLLNQATQWNGKNIALLALASKRSVETKISEEALYGLFRAGLPSELEDLALVSSDTVGKALDKAEKAGVINLAQDQIKTATQAHEAFVHQRRLDTKPPGALSTFGQLLGGSGLAQAQQDSFEKILLESVAEPNKIWDKCREANFSEAQVNSLQTQGKLGHLTLFNLPLMNSIKGVTGEDPTQLYKLAEGGFYEPGKWIDQIRGLGLGLEKVIPPDYFGLNPEEQLARYAEDLARKIRLAYPTDVLLHKLANDKIIIDRKDPGPNARVSIFLKKEVRRFRFGQITVRKFTDREDFIFPPGTTKEEQEKMVQELERLHRTHQLTPSDEAMQVLLDEKLTSAHEILEWKQEDIVNLFKGKGVSEYQAKFVYQKAAQIHGVAYNFLTIAKEGEAAPGMYVTSGANKSTEVDAQRENFREKLIQEFPSLESLFGSLDFCECEHCRSVLSPAAYFVDLLHFLDPSDAVWGNFLGKWKHEHNGADFTQERPFDALMARRPDLGDLPLTCENTNVALPTVDLVNEILESFIVYQGDLNKAEIHDTGGATTPELLAEPQHLLAAAYDELQKAVYPIGLPFDLWLEMARKFFEQSGSSFAQALDALKDEQSLFRPVGAVNKRCYQAEVFMEQLGLSPSEVAIFTQSDIAGNWFKYYGYPDAASASAELSSAKKLARRLGLSYKELVALLRTGFINPALKQLGLLDKLGISALELMRYNNIGGEPPLTEDEKAVFKKKLEALSNQYSTTNPGFDLGDELEKLVISGKLDQALELADTNTGCNFETTRLRFLDNDPITPEIFHKINLFVRLWRKLGWTIEEVDRALQVFYPVDPAVTLDKAMQSALIYLAHFKSIEEKLGLDKKWRIKLLCFWSDIPTTGVKPLYAQLFLTRSVLKNDPVFDDPLGNYLSDPSAWPVAQRPLLNEHLPTLQSVIGLSAEDIQLLAREILPNTYLSLGNVSALYRYAVLAKVLKISIAELISLRKWTEIDPFKPLLRGALSNLEEDYPFTQTLKFIEVAQLISTADFKVTELEYLFRDLPHEKYKVKQVTIDTILSTLAQELQQIKANFAIPDPAREWPDEAIGEKFKLLSITEVGEDRTVNEKESVYLLNLWAGIAETELLRLNLEKTDQIGGADFLKKHAIKANYDATQKVEQIIFKGYLAQKIIDEAPANLKAILNPIRAQQQSMLKGTLQKLNSTKFTDATLEELFQFTPSADGLDSEKLAKEYKAWETKRRQTLAEGMLPILEEQEQQAVVVATVSTGIDPDSNELLQSMLINQYLLEWDNQALWTVFIKGTPLDQSNVYIQLQKANRWIAGLNLGTLALIHFISHPIDFAGFDLNLFAAPASDDKAKKLMRQHLRLLGYNQLKGSLETEDESLIEVFQSARGIFPQGTLTEDISREVLDKACKQLADLLGKDTQEIKAMAIGIGMAVQTQNLADNTIEAKLELVNEQGVNRLLNAWLVKERMRSSVVSVLSWAKPIVKSATALNLRNTIKGLYEVEQWQNVARPIFDDLRRKQRDALVAFILHNYGPKPEFGFDTLEELYEYLLIDPGMEPIVQTSRLRQAIFSVQLFVQRCLLNLEKQVHPSTINARHWEWMKRYRVWEANRKIFLYPENWLEPEFRDDKTHLYKALESELLQGDVSNELAERAFFTYLKGLEQIARLEMVTMYLEEVEPTDPSSNTLHVIGRTPNKPHRYFYRKYAHGSWTPWEPVEGEIESDHVILVKWRDRLHLFWLMFLQKPVPKTISGNISLGSDKENKIDATTVSSLNADIELHVQTNWVEYFQGEWKGRQTSSFEKIGQLNEPGFNPREKIFLHATVDTTVENKESIETDLNLHLTGTVQATIKLVSKLSPPEVGQGGVAAQEFPYKSSSADLVGFATKKKSTQTGLQVSFVQEIINNNNPNKSQIDILKSGLSNFTLLTTSTPFLMGDSNAKDDRNLIGSLVRPFFYEDNQHTFYVEPTFDEVTIDRYEHWVIPEYVPPKGAPITVVDDLVLEPIFPKYWDFIEIEIPGRKPGFGGDPLDPRANFTFKDPQDWVTNPQTMILYDDVLISDVGGFSPEVFLAPITTPGNVFQPNLATGLPQTGLDQMLPVNLSRDKWSEFGSIYNSGQGFSIVGGGGVTKVGNFNASNLGGLTNILKIKTGGFRGF